MILARRFLNIVTAFLVSLVPVSVQSHAQNGGLAAQARDVRSALIQPGTASTLLPFVVDPSGQGGDLFQILSSEPGAIVTLILPNGTEVSSSNAASLGYQYDVIPAINPNLNADTPPSPFSNPSTQTLITLPQTVPAGNYQVKVNASTPTRKTLIVATYFSTSAIITSVVTDEEDYKVGDTVVVSAFVFNNTTPITNANVVATGGDASIPSAFTLQLPLVDSGTYDAAVGDGIYTGSFIPTVAGKYTVIVRTTGTSSSGTNYSRTATTTINVRPATAEFSSFTASGIDDNGNGRADQLEVTANVNIQTAGKYVFMLSLEGNNGKTIRSSNEATLATGSQQIKLTFPASSFVDPKNGTLLLGTSGPFTMKRAELRYIGESDAYVVERRENAGTTGSFSFERNSIIFTGQNSISTPDVNGNGKYDSLSVTAQVNLLDAGNYVWQARLVDPNGNEVTNYNVLSTLLPLGLSSASLSAGMHTLTFNFDGQLINRSGKNGPYTVETAVLYSTDVAANATAVHNLITSSALQATQFEPPIILECRNFLSSLPAGQSTVTVNYPLPNAKGAIYPVTTACTPPPGSSFPAGVTTINCTTTESISNLTTSCSGTVNVTGSADTTPPTISCPANVYTAITYGLGSGPVTYPNPVVSDNRTGATFSCTPASGANFFRGTTAVSCTATDTSNNQANCGFNVSVFDVSLQDNQSKHTLWFNSTTGSYYFFSCDGGGYTLSGQGTITRQGCEVRLGGDPRVSATFVACTSTPSVRYGNALIKPNPVGGWFYITDSNSLDNLNGCPSN